MNSVQLNVCKSDAHLKVLLFSQFTQVKVNIGIFCICITSIYHYCNEKTLRLSKKPEETLSGTEKTLRDPEVGTENTAVTLRDPEVGTEGTEEDLRDPEVGTEGTEKTLRDLEVGT